MQLLIFVLESSEDVSEFFSGRHFLPFWQQPYVHDRWTDKQIAVLSAPPYGAAA